MFAAARDTFGRVDAVLNVAGIGGFGMLAELPLEEYDRVLNVNLKGVMLGTKHGINAMIPTGGGSIVNWASIGGLGASPGTSAYSASKAGVISFTKSAAVEYGTQGVRANAVCPGFVETALTGGPGSGARFPQLIEASALKRAGQPEEVAELASFLALGPRQLHHRRRHLHRRRHHRQGGLTDSTAPVAAARYAGSRVHRVEDARLLTGHGTFVDDVVRPGMLHACFVRSPFPRARLLGIDASAALALEGVHAVFTAADLNPGVHELWYTMIGKDVPDTPRPPLAEGEARFVGDPVALVVADEPLPRRGRRRPRRGRLRAAHPGRRLRVGAGRRGARPRGLRAATSPVACAAATATRWRRCSSRPPTSSARRSTSRRTPPCRWRPAGWSSSGRAASSRSGRPRSRRTRCGRWRRGCSASTSTGSG